MMARLSRLDWLDRGLEVLAQAGFGGLRAEPLAKSLNVSRGSFYWHFGDIEEFHAALLHRWRERATDQIIAEVDMESSHRARLGRLMRLGMAGDNGLERNIRSWAAQCAVASDVVGEVDKARVGYLSRLLKAAGVPGRQACSRAAFIYWAYIGRIMVRKGQGNLSEEELDSLAELLQS